jgi:dTDP-4-dehydrorhamnose 3,5-epimerase|tara:strand:- start:23 stop:592 length:570 start_codon:yes stop_codon:yes gene_type:complete
VHRGREVNFIPQSISDVVLIEPNIHGDARGYFIETFRQDLLEKVIGYKVNFVQDNESKSTKGVLRGLHYQLDPFTQAKLVRVIEGSVIDVAVDIRKSSPTFGKHVSKELSAQNKHQLFIPRGFAHGFMALTDTATFVYKVDNYYSQDHERGLFFDDKQLDINWGLPYEILQISEKDIQLPSLDKIEKLF